MKYLITSVLTMMSMCLGAQELAYERHSISINILSFASPYHFNVNVSYQYRFSDRIAIDFGLAPIYPGDFIDGPVGRKNGNGAILRIEPKVFLSNWQVVDTTHSVFLSTKFYISYHDFVDVTSREYGKYDDLSRVNVRNFVFGIVPQIGKQGSGGGEFGEFSVGFGSRWVFVDSNLTEVASSPTPSEDTQFFHHTLPGWRRHNTIGLNLKGGVNF